MEKIGLPPFLCNGPFASFHSRYFPAGAQFYTEIQMGL